MDIVATSIRKTLKNKKVLFLGVEFYDYHSKIKESMTDVINKNHTPNTKRKGSNFQTIKTRNFDPTSDEDTNLLITKEILEDMINRITFQYESNDYLKRYISTRLQEIVKINALLTLDDDDIDE